MRAFQEAMHMYRLFTMLCRGTAVAIVYRHVAAPFWARFL